MPDTSLVHGSIPSLRPDDALPFVRDKMLELIEQVSGRLDKNFVLQAIVIFAGIVFVWKGQPEKLELPLGLTLPGIVVGYVIPLILIKLILDWGYESYQYLLVRHYLTNILTAQLGEVTDYLPQRRQDVLLPATMYKFIYDTEGGRNWVTHIAHFVLMLFIILITSFNYLIVLYYTEVNVPTPLACLFVLVLYPVYYSLHWFALRKHLKVSWYGRSIAFLIVIHLIVACVGPPLLDKLDESRSQPQNSAASEVCRFVPCFLRSR